ncbi:unnamed protein product [Calypogeia fissa]
MYEERMEVREKDDEISRRANSGDRPVDGGVDESMGFVTKKSTSVVEGSGGANYVGEQRKISEYVNIQRLNACLNPVLCHTVRSLAHALAARSIAMNSVVLCTPEDQQQQHCGTHCSSSNYAATKCLSICPQLLMLRVLSPTHHHRN